MTVSLTEVGNLGEQAHLCRKKKSILDLYFIMPFRHTNEDTE